MVELKTRRLFLKRSPCPSHLTVKDFAVGSKVTNERTIDRSNERTNERTNGRTDKVKYKYQTLRVGWTPLLVIACEAKQGNYTYSSTGELSPIWCVNIGGYMRFLGTSWVLILVTYAPSVTTGRSLLSHGKRSIRSTNQTRQARCIRSKGALQICRTQFTVIPNQLTTSRRLIAVSQSWNSDWYDMSGPNA